VCGFEKPTALTKYFETKLAVIEVKDGETQEEAWQRYLLTNPGNCNAHIKIFHYPEQSVPEKGSGGRTSIQAIKRKRLCLKN
jgi:hypothetical protein